jgi:hypothetical protein
MSGKRQNPSQIADTFIRLMSGFFCKLCGYDFYAPIRHTCKST